MTHPFTKKKFLSLSLTLQHRHAALMLKSCYSNPSQQLINNYKELEKWLQLPEIKFSDEPLSHRFHLHCQKARLTLKEPEFLTKPADKESNVPFLPHFIYLDHLRSAHNVGSILRTIEAFRLGGALFGGSTPFIDQKKVQDCSMHTFDKVDCIRDLPLDALKQPLIALETLDEAESIYETIFPAQFTLILGNEEFGISKQLLSKADKFVKIPLQGYKNSLNVACAFAIAAAEIRRQQPFQEVHAPAH